MCLWETNPTQMVCKLAHMMLYKGLQGPGIQGMNMEIRV